MSGKRRLHIWISPHDRMRLELIRDVFGVSLSAAFRVAIRAASEKLGLEKDAPEKNSTTAP